MTKLSLTLNKANKILEKINNELKEDSIFGRMRNTDSAFITCSFSPTTSSKTIINEISKKVNKEHSEFEKKSNLIKDKFSLKQKIFEANVSSGLSSILSKIDIAKSTISILESILIQNQNEQTYSIEQITQTVVELEVERIKSKEELRNVSFVVKLYKEEEIKQQLQEFKKELNRLEDEKNLKNAETKIEVVFEELTIEFLGLGF
jgi:hypothetical protein